MKTCTRCKLDKPVEEFNFRNKTAGKYQPHCRDCQKAEMRASYLSNKQHYIKNAAVRSRFYQQQYKNWKNTLACVMCPESEPCCIELHHLDPLTKEGDPSALFRKVGADRYREELLKCVVVCSNCHKKIHRGLIVIEETHVISSKLLIDRLIRGSYQK